MDSCNKAQGVSQVDVCLMRFKNIDESINRLEASISVLRNMMWGQITTLIFVLISFVISQIK